MSDPGFPTDKGASHAQGHHSPAPRLTERSRMPPRCAPASGQLHIRTPMTARAKPYAAARGSITPIRIASGLFAVSTAPATADQVPGETDMFVP